MKTLFISLVWLLFTFQVFSQVVNVNNTQTSEMGSVGAAAGNNLFVQSFTASIGTITEFRVYLKQTVSQGEVELIIYKDNGSGKPDLVTPLYTSALIPPIALGQVETITGLNIPITVGQKYFVGVFNNGIGGTTGTSNVGTSTTPTNSNEFFLISNDNGVSWLTQTTYLSIYVAGIAPPPPIPISPFPIVIVGFLVGGFIVWRKKRIA